MRGSVACHGFGRSKVVRYVDEGYIGILALNSGRSDRQIPSHECMNVALPVQVHGHFGSFTGRCAHKDKATIFEEIVLVSPAAVR